ncbi:PucR family transcriptional regulator [Phytoactinopolyspora endophytica]|uniref:PucR family transcriptional regulator n=1 Tax=Phytoactinopolyspora endophytica TaxID=1642495 RepID=UPI00197BF31D|nr:helix-turn-helix domain-containing protein [Phytoactinopolyspora endophytica]
MTQFTVAHLLQRADRLGMRLVAGPVDAAIARVEVVELPDLRDATYGTLVIVPGDAAPAPYLVDVALRQASALGLAGVVFSSGFTLTETAGALAERGRVPVLVSEGIRATDLAVAIDRVISGGAAETMTRASYAIEQASAIAADPARSADDMLAAAGAALGISLTMQEDPNAAWTDRAAVFIGEVPIGRVVAEVTDPAASFAVPIVASLISRSLHRQIRERFAPNQSRADLIVELVLAEAARVDAFIAPAARLGLPLHLTHAAAWLRPRQRFDPNQRPPHAVAPAVELFALQLVEEHPELWHIAYIQDDALIVSTQDHGAGDHQRRLREVATRIQDYAQTLAGDEWTYTLGLGTPQPSAAGLRQSAAEARVAADSAIAAGRLGGVEVTDVTGLRRVLLDFYASPISRNLLQDVLQPLDALGPERATTAVRTLVAYLSNRNSLTHAGRELTLHPNAVGYRMKRIRELLDVDLNDPDTRFAVELACRVRLLGGAGT